MISDAARAVHDDIRAAMAAAAAVPPPTLAERRRNYDHRVAAASSVPPGVVWTKENIARVPTVRAQAQTASSAAPAESDCFVLFMHGGGYSAGSADAYRNLTGHLVNAIGCSVIAVDYRLAPEHRFPAGIIDATAVYRRLIEAGIAPGRIALVGESAGGGLAVATALKLRDNGQPRPAAIVAMSPWVDLEGLGDSVHTNADKDLLATSGVLAMLKDEYVGSSGDPRDPLASPIYAKYAGISPLYIQVGTDEILFDDSTRLRDAAERDGVDVAFDAFDGMQHVFQMYAGRLPEADDALAKVAEFPRPRLGKTYSSRRANSL